MEFFVGLLTILVVIAAIAAHVSFALGVLRDSDDLARRSRQTVLAPGWAWAIVTLACGLIGALAYWLIHHSTLRAPESPPPAT